MRMFCHYSLLVPKENVIPFIKALTDHLEGIQERKYCFVLSLKNVNDMDPNHPSLKINSLPTELQNYEVLGVHNGSIDYLSFSRVENGDKTVYKESEINFAECKNGFISVSDKQWDKYPMYLHSEEWNKKHNPTFKSKQNNKKSEA